MWEFSILLEYSMYIIYFWISIPTLLHGLQFILCVISQVLGPRSRPQLKTLRTWLRGGALWRWTKIPKNKVKVALLPYPSMENTMLCSLVDFYQGRPHRESCISFPWLWYMKYSLSPERMFSEGIIHSLAKLEGKTHKFQFIQILIHDSSFRNRHFTWV
jgi:hypothetical protein